MGLGRVREARVIVCRTNVVPLAPTAMSEPRTETPSFLPHNEVSEAPSPLLRPPTTERRKPDVQVR